MYEIAQGYERFVLQSLYCILLPLFRYYLDSQEPVQLGSIHVQSMLQATSAQPL